MAHPLSPTDRANALKTLVGWTPTPDRNALSKTFRFADFKQAFAFMSTCAAHAEALNHHPEWTNVYATVSVTLTTHDAGGLTDLDIDLARFMDATAA